MSELKPCPRCGGKAHLVPFNLSVIGKDGVSEDRVAWFVACTDKCRKSKAHVIYKYKDDAVDAWNERAEA